jgi:energy-coupling factor transporter ATP-binding protein EcfA2
MLFGDVLVAKGLITEADIERALDYQQEHGGRFGDCLVSLGLIREEQIGEVLNETPPSPRNLADIDVDQMLLLQLMVKGIHMEALETPSQIAGAMKLPSSIVNELVQQAIERKLAGAVGQAPSNGGAFPELRYRLTQAGRDWAIESLDRSQYFGPAPVTLEAYQERVLRQRLGNERFSRSDIRNAFREMVIPSRFVDRLGPAINSGSAILIYGPAGNGKTTIAETVSRVFGNVIYIPYCFEVDGHIVKVFDPSVHKPISRSPIAARAPSAIHRESQDQRWVPCLRPTVISGGELTLEMLDLKFSEISNFYEAPLHIKALNGVFVVDDFGRQRVDPADLLNRWTMPLNNRVDYLSLHTGKSFQVPFDELVIFSTNMHPSDLMDPAFLRRLHYKIETVGPTEELFRRVFEDVCRREGLVLEEEIYQQVLTEISANGTPLAYFQPAFIVGQVLAACKFEGIDPCLTRENVREAMLNLFVTSRA